MKIAYNPKSAGPLKTAPSGDYLNAITFDLASHNIFTRGEMFKGTDTTYEVFKKATQNAVGYNGLVPAPTYNNNSKCRYLREDGVWVIPSEDPYGTVNFNPTSISLDRNWKATGFLLNESNGFSTGVYIIKIMSGNLMFSGTVSVVVGKITVDDEIVLHMSGIPLVYEDGTQGRIYAKIAPSATADYGEVFLATNVPQSAITNLSITMKKMI